jgi:hypothetical protein
MKPGERKIEGQCFSKLNVGIVVGVMMVLLSIVDCTSTCNTGEKVTGFGGF